MRAKNLAALLMALATVLSSAAALVTAFRAEAEVKAVDERLYDQAAQGIGDNADELYHLKQQIAALEAAGGRR